MNTLNMKTDLNEILNPLSTYFNKVDENIKLKLSTGIPIIDESAIHIFLRGGKKIRAALLILASGLKGNVPEGTIELAAAAEIVHAASLIHDDIIDQSFIRRGDVSVPKKWGNKIAVLIGDYMYSVALRASIDDGNPVLFPVMVEGTKDMVKGELVQLQYSDIDSINEQHYFNIIELKTARFMAACAKLGALKAGLNSDECEKLYHFGLSIGFAFQIIDDTLDLLGESDIIGKDVGSDFKDGKITLPFLYLLQNSNGTDYKILKDYTLNPDDDGWLIIKNRLRESGAIAYSIDYARKYIKHAIEIISTFPDSEFKNILIELSYFFINRNY